MAPRPRTVPRKSPRQERSKATVDAILAATARILVTHGYDHASTNRVALAAGVSIGSLYQYFPSKESLVAALMERHTEEIMAVCARHLAGLENQPMGAGVRALICALLEAKAANPKLHRVLIEQVPRVGRMANVCGGLDRQLETIVRAQLEARRDEVLPRDHDLAAFLLVHTVRSLTFAAVVERPEALQSKALADEITAIVMRYLTGASA